MTGLSIRFPDSGKIYQGLFAGISLTAIVLRSIGLDKGIWLDEFYTIRIISSPNIFAAMKLVDNQPPLYFMLLKIWSLGGMSEVHLRFLSVLLSMGTLVVLMLWLKLYSRLGSIVAGVIYACLPIALRYAQELRDYQLLILGTALAFLFASYVVRNPLNRKFYWGLAAGLSLAVFGHLVGVMVLGSVLFFILGEAGFRPRRLDIRSLCLAFLVPGLIFGYLFLFFVPPKPAAGNWWMLEISSDVLRTTWGYLSGADAFRHMVGFLARELGIASQYLVWSFGISVLVWAIIIICLGNWRLSWVFLAAALFYVLEISAYSVFFTPVFFYNTILPALVPFVGFLALELTTIRPASLQKLSLVGLAVVCVIYAVYWARVQAHIPVEPWRQVAEFIRSKGGADDLIVYFPSYACGPTDYYLANSGPPTKILTDFGSNGYQLYVWCNASRVSADDTEALDALIDWQVSQRSHPNREYQIFLVVRDGDSNVWNNYRLYEDLVANLAKKTGSVPIKKKFGPLSVRIYEGHVR